MFLFFVVFGFIFFVEIRVRFLKKRCLIIEKEFVYIFNNFVSSFDDMSLFYIIFFIERFEYCLFIFDLKMDFKMIKEMKKLCIYLYFLKYIDDIWEKL